MLTCLYYTLSIHRVELISLFIHFQRRESQSSKVTEISVADDVSVFEEDAQQAEEQINEAQDTKELSNSVPADAHLSCTDPQAPRKQVLELAKTGTQSQEDIGIVNRGCSIDRQPRDVRKNSKETTTHC